MCDVLPCVVARSASPPGSSQSHSNTVSLQRFDRVAVHRSDFQPQMTTKSPDPFDCFRYRPLQSRHKAPRRPIPTGRACVGVRSGGSVKSSNGVKTATSRGASKKPPVRHENIWATPWLFHHPGNTPDDLDAFAVTRLPRRIFPTYALRPARIEKLSCHPFEKVIIRGQVSFLGLPLGLVVLSRLRRTALLLIQ